MKRHHWLMLAAVALFLAGWLVWNVLLVERDVSAPRGRVVPPPAAARHART